MDGNNKLSRLRRDRMIESVTAWSRISLQELNYTALRRERAGTSTSRRCWSSYTHWLRVPRMHRVVRTTVFTVRRHATYKTSSSLSL